MPGYGIALVREFVNLHGGYLQILSEEGQGSRFAVLIPAGRAQLPQERVGDKSPGPSLNTIVRSFVKEALSSMEEISPELPHPAG